MSFNSPNKVAAHARAMDGFTLIEVMIVMAILAFISLGIFQTTTSSFKLRDELVQESDFYTSIRLAMGIMNKDIMMIYSPTLLLATPPGTASQSGVPTPGSSPTPRSPTVGGSNIDESQIAAATAADLAQSYTFWSAAADKSGLRPSRFNGQDNKMSFITATNFRIYKDSPESEFAKVIYMVERDDGPPINGLKIDNSYRLVKIQSANVFENDDMKDRDAQRKYTLLRGVTACKFNFYRWEDNSFKKFTTWDSDKEDFKWQMPDVVEIELEVKGASGLSYTGSYRFKPELPLHGLNPSF